MTSTSLPKLFGSALLCLGVACAAPAPGETAGEDGGDSDDEEEEGSGDEEDSGSGDEDDADADESNEDDESAETSGGPDSGNDEEGSSTSGGSNNDEDEDDEDSTATTSSSDDDDDSAGPSTSDSGQTTDCEFEITPSLAMIPTVGVVEWSTTLEGVTEAEIHFGLDDGYGMVAPVDLEEANYRTLLLGMKPNSDYHFKIVATAGGERCESEDQAITTDPMPNGQLPSLTIDTRDEGARNGGFKVMSTWQGSTAFIVDADGDFVWWNRPGHDVTRARMSYDGKTMWMRNVNVQGGDSRITRISMDGTGAETFNNGVLPGHHDFTVLPDGAIAFIAFEQGSTQCDQIVEMDTEGNLTTVFDIRDGVPSLVGGQACHSNAIHYNEFDDSYTVSQRDYNTILKFNRSSGELEWVIGGASGTNSFSGDASWSVQHGHHNIDDTHILLFSNNGIGGGGGGGFPGGGGTSMALEYELNLDSMTATRVWDYSVSGTSSFTLGDVQRLPNGNTLITFSNAGTIHEVDSSKNLVESISAALGGPAGGDIGYVDVRPTLYGPPPR